MRALTYPFLPEKIQENSVTTANQYIKTVYPSAHPYFQKYLHKTIIFCFDKGLAALIKKKFKMKKRNILNSDLYQSKDTPSVFLLSEFGTGPSVIATQIEIFAALGFSHIFTLGYSGTLNPALVGKLCVILEAIPDEGVSQHYGQNDELVALHSDVQEYIKHKIKEFEREIFLVKSWSISAIFRETLLEIKKFRDMGVETVEMEAASVLTLINYFNLKGCAMVFPVDTLDDMWRLESPKKITDHLIEKIKLLVTPDE